MRLRRIVLAGCGALGVLVLARAVTRGQPADPAPAEVPLRLPPIEAAYPLPPLPPQSPRIANYTIDAKLDVERHQVQGSLVLEWRNTSDQALSTFPFHLYWNAFRNNLSTSARGEGRRAARPGVDGVQERSFGFTHVTSVKLLSDGGETDLLPTLRYIHPDDDNADDRTVMEVETPHPVAAGATARFKVEWTSRIPYGDRGRAGWVHDYHFIVQWFPKIGVFSNGQWNCHQFHPTTEFFADFGVYDVKLTLPAGFVVGATGRLQGEPTKNADGTLTHRFVQEDVHDFAWCASRRFVERKSRFDDPGYPPVDIRLLVQPEHAHLADRYLAATKISLRSYGTWSAPYPYPQITVVDPAWSSASGGMEYPTLFTGGASIWSPEVLHSPEGVTIHECGHQFWYGLAANNEFEEAWLDEGFNSYHDEKSAFIALGPQGWGRRYFGPRGGRGPRGWPVVAPGVAIGRGEGDISALRRRGQTDVMARRAWEYRTPDAYTLNSYGKPALALQTLENLVGDDTMTRILRTYARRQRFGHPTTRDFIDTVNQVTGQDYTWFFNETFYSSELCDYAVQVRSAPARTPDGLVDGPAGPVPAPRPSPAERGKQDGRPYDSEVTVLRLGGVRMPVDLLVRFADGQMIHETWDGQYRWRRFRYHRPAKVVGAVVDPDRKLSLDVDPSNNSWREDGGQARRAATKWSTRFLIWLQNLLELHTVIG